MRADHTLDYALGAFTVGTTRYDLIFDLVGNHSLTALRRVLTRKGTLVLASGTGNRTFGPMGRVIRAAAVSPFVSQRLVPFSQSGTAATLNDLNDLIEAGHVTPTIERTYPLAETPDAARHFAHGHPGGKLAISL